MNGKITQKRNTPLPSVLVLAAGVGLLVLVRMAAMGDTLMAACLTVGVILTAAGLIVVAMNLSGAMTHFVYQPTRSRMRDRTVYLAVDDYNAAVEALVAANAKPLAGIRPVTTSNAALRILSSGDGVCVLVQATRDQNGHFEPEAEPLLLLGDDTAAVRHLMK